MITETTSGNRSPLLAELAPLPLDGGGGREAAGGGARSGAESNASGGSTGNAGGPHPLRRAARDSSPVEGEQGARFSKVST
jgi:hypothetical protein